MKLPPVFEDSHHIAPFWFMDVSWDDAMENLLATRTIRGFNHCERSFSALKIWKLADLPTNITNAKKQIRYKNGIVWFDSTNPLRMDKATAPLPTTLLVPWRHSWCQWPGLEYLLFHASDVFCILYDIYVYIYIFFSFIYIYHILSLYGMYILYTAC